MFLDTSSLFKLYYQEVDSSDMEKIFINQDVTTVFLSALTIIEFSSTLWRKVRMQELSDHLAQSLISFFEDDFSKFTFVPIDSIVIEHAQTLLTKYGKQGLRTLDSLQLATAVLLKGKGDVFFTADALLKSFFIQEALPIEVAGK